MLFLITILHLLDLLTATSKIFWFVVAVVDLFAQLLRSVQVELHHFYYSRAAEVELRRSLQFLRERKAHPPPRRQLKYHPRQVRQEVVWRKLFKTTELPKEEEKKKNWLAFLATLTGAVFEAAVEEIATKLDDAPLLRKWGLRLTGEERALLVNSEGNPVVWLDAPEDGDWMAQPGERDGPKVRQQKGLLCVPRRRGRAGKAEKKKEEERRRSASR